MGINCLGTMKTLREALFNKKNLNSKNNPYGITEEDMIDDLEGFPVGVVVRMMEEQEAVGNAPDVAVFQEDNTADRDQGGFDWDESVERYNFWDDVITDGKFYIFFEKYPNYKRY